MKRFLLLLIICLCFWIQGFAQVESKKQESPKEMVIKLDEKVSIQLDLLLSQVALAEAELEKKKLETKNFILQLQVLLKASPLSTLRKDDKGNWIFLEKELKENEK